MTEEKPTELTIENDTEPQQNPPETIVVTQNSCLIYFKQKCLIFGVLIVSIILTLVFIGIVIGIEHSKEEIRSNDDWKENMSPEKEIWYDLELKELLRSLKIKQNTKLAKNVILFVGDGMGPASITGARIYRYGTNGSLSWERFPHMGILKTFCADKQVPDSMASATALFGGVKGNYETGGVDSFVKLRDCENSLNKTHQVESILHWAQKNDMSTGFVTNTRVMHATPAVLYAHVPDRRWECEAKMDEESLKSGCKDIAKQLIESLPGKNFNVIMGGGRQCLVSNVNETISDPIDKWACYSKDGRNLIKDWKKDKRERQLKYAVIKNNEELRNLNSLDTDYVLGIFANGHLSYEDKRDDGPNGMPSLMEMTTKAIEILSKNTENGFVLVVESGLIDQAHHRGWAKRALSEVIVLDETVNQTLNIMKSKLDETLIIVTSDHSHTLTINGYPDRENSIFGIAGNSKFDGIPYTTLTYGTGHFGYQVDIENGSYHRHDPSKDDYESFEYVQQVAVKTDENTHGGMDVPVHAIGPWSHLFHGLHDQTYVAHVIAYAAKIGRFQDNDIVNKMTDFLGF